MNTRRRDFLVKTSAMGMGLVATGGYALPTTPRQTEGPFFPVHDPEDLDADLTRVVGREVEARGEKVRLHVRVVDHNNNPVPNAEVHMWQACETGRYLHPEDPNTSAELDPNFQYWTRLFTSRQGTTTIKTIIPGAYPATANWDRPPHLHFKILLQGQEALVTQMYFAGQSLNAIDSILQRTRDQSGDEAADSLVIDFSRRNGDDLPSGTFTIKLGTTPLIP